MKLIYKIELKDTYTKKYLTEEEASKIYNGYGRRTYELPKHIPHGFFTKCLTFSEWLEYYNISLI
jgi:hypothetical protein